MQDHPPAGSSSSSSQYSSPPFSPQRHYQLQAELKQLYVAATRAMVQLVWFEGDEAKAQPMRDLLVTQVGQCPLGLKCPCKMAPAALL